MSFEQTTVAEIRKMLVETGKYTEEEAAAVKGKPELVFRLKQLGINKPVGYDKPTDYAQVFADAEVINESKDTEDSVNTEFEPFTQKKPVRITDENWQAYVMSKFENHELVEGCPTVDGLRRVSELLLGEIVFSGPVEYTPSTDGTRIGRASVMYEVRIAWALGLEWLGEGDTIPLRCYRAVADSWNGNTDPNFAAYPLAIAETRAEARALRKALRINTVSHEEKTQLDVTKIAEEETVVQKDEEWNPYDCISGAQIAFIRKKCDAHGIDLMKFINLGKTKYESIEDVTKTTALKMIEQLNRYQSEAGEGESVEIPEKIKKTNVDK